MEVVQCFEDRTSDWREPFLTTDGFSIISSCRQHSIRTNHPSSHRRASAAREPIQIRRNRYVVCVVGVAADDGDDEHSFLPSHSNSLTKENYCGKYSFEHSVSARNLACLNSRTIWKGIDYISRQNRKQPTPHRANRANVDSHLDETVRL